jgi:endo-1,4-beta-xylanase
MENSKNKALSAVSEKDLRKYYKSGLLITIIFISSFGFLLLSPFIPNEIGRLLDERYYNEALERIPKIRKGNFSIQITYTNGTPVIDKEISFRLIKHEFLFGAMFFHFNEFPDNATNMKYAQLFSDVFNFAMLPFYFDSWASPENFTIENRINASIEYLHSKNITTKGHTLVWNHPAGIPKWLGDINQMESTQIESIFKSRIQSVLTKYKENISVWDITNEFAHRPPFGSLNTEEFADKCFRWAREVHSAGTFIFNDYGMMGHDFGYGDAYRFLAKLNRLETPYDAIGMQSHAMDTDWVPTYEIYRTLEGFATLNKQIHITEFFATSLPVAITNSWKKGLWSEENQAEYAKRFYTMCFSHPSVSAISWWGFEDGKNKQRDPGYGLLNNDLTPKLSYFVLKDLIRNQWNTNGTVRKSTAEPIQFNGFYGEYEILIEGVPYFTYFSSAGAKEVSLVLT